MADKSSMSAINTIIVFGLIIGLCIWLAMVLTSQGERRLEQACKPVEYSTQFLHEMVTTVIGRQPTWTLYVQSYLMTGCYYGFSVIMSEGTSSSPLDGSVIRKEEEATGGIQ